ncbi:hypothetical protein LTR36_000594 [Oleoguttula mirabilis]|uniref:EF-hand domain-containing protein n=1 Tax=Oleoguttula mirabilis TaxID=1507867 RepID=A0AAV9JQE8_9PEZI|nr:hypothetical protein LTR36_000594 [Oleoguttula mirabilis]
MSLRSQPSKRAHFSREGFSPIPLDNHGGMAPNDATIDIPLEQIPTNNGGGGLRNENSMTALRPSGSNGNKERRQFFRGRRVKPAAAGHKTGRVGYDGEVDQVNAMGRLYKKILGSSIIMRYLVFVLPLGALIAIPIVVGATAAQEAKIGGVRIVWFFSWVEVVWASLWGSKIVAHFMPWLFQVLAGVVSSGVRKYSMVIRSLEIPLSLVGWGIASVATFKPIMTRNPTQLALQREKKDTASKEWEDIVEKILAAAVISSLIYLGEKLIVQLISIDYHRKQFAFRIKESKHNVYLLSLLYDASRALFPAYCHEFAEEDYIISDQLNLSSGLGSKNRSSHQRSGSTTPMRLIQDIGRYGDKLTSAFGNVAHEITGREVFNPNSAHSIVVEALERKRCTEALAKRIWMSFVAEGKEALYQDDVMDVLGPERRTEAEEAFAALDQDANGDVSLDEMILTISELSRERKAITTSMHDVDQAINVLDNLLSLVVFVAVIMVFVGFLNKSFVTTLATAGTALLSLSFVFSVTCQEILGSCIFVFVKHPFDVGDRVDLGLEQFTVEHISLLFTVFRRVSGAHVGRSVQIPNIVLNSLWVENVSRSKAMSEQLEIDVSFDTSFDDLQTLKNELQKFVTDKDNSRDFQPEIELGILGTSDQSKLMLQVEVKHKSNWANETIRQARRSKFMCALVSALRTVPIYAPGGGGEVQGSAANPNYGVTINDNIAKQNVAKAAETKEGKRMVPTKKIEEAMNSMSPIASGKSGAAGLTSHDNKVVDDLTSRNPAYDPARDEAWTSSREDTSTLGDRPSIDPQDLEDVRGLLRRGSTRGKRKPGSEAPQLRMPGIPTIHEPDQVSYEDWATPSYTGYENQTPGPSTVSTAYTPQLRNQPTRYESAQTQPLSTETSPVEMRQVAPSRSPSNPYRKRSDSLSRKPISPTAGGGSKGEDEFENTRPYSGV